MTLRWIQAATATAVGVVAVLLTPLLVFGHADYESSVPARNETVPDAPDRVDVFFTQDVRKREGLYYVRVFSELGLQMSQGDGMVDDDDRSHIFADLPADLAPGRYIAEWMTTSDVDGDSDEGAFCFYVAVEPAEDQQNECAVFDEDVPPTSTAPTARTVEPADDVVDATLTGVARDGNGGPGEDGGTSTGLVIGIIAGIVVAVVVVGGAVVWLRRS